MQASAVNGLISFAVTGSRLPQIRPSDSSAVRKLKVRVLQLVEENRQLVKQVKLQDERMRYLAERIVELEAADDRKS
jgi:hypothetical protein